MSEKYARYDKVERLPDNAEWTARMQTNDESVFVVMDDEGNIHRMGENIDIYEVESDE